MTILKNKSFLMAAIVVSPIAQKNIVNASEIEKIVKKTVTA
jgi:hypothetical protein